jgi:flagellar basal body-associated protein FliL
MFYDIVAVARDWSILILALPTLVILAGIVYAMWHVAKAARGFFPRVRPALQSAAGAVQDAAGAVDNARNRVQAPFLWVQTAPTGVSAFLRALRR